MINYVTGDATHPPPPPSGGTRIIAHICNDKGTWGAGFVLALSLRDKHPEEAYKAWRGEPGFELGKMRLVAYAEPGLWVANMIAQHGFGEEGRPPIRYLSLANCLRQLQGYADLRLDPVTFHMPRIGCGLGGGTWDNVEPLINYFLRDPVTVYDLPIPNDTTNSQQP